MVAIRKVTGTKIASKEEVIYTPPEGEGVLRNKLSNLEKFLYAEDNIDPLIKLAILHYQFEAIHPFTDGNGRTGRIINILFLIEKGLLDSPILFLSHHILRTKTEYYRHLRRTTEQSAWGEWIIYILDAIAITAKETQERVNKILSAMDYAKGLVQAKAPKIQSKDLIEIIFRHPYSKVQFLVDAGLVQSQAAAVYLRQLEELGLLRAEKVGREQYYMNTRLVEILSK